MTPEQLKVMQDSIGIQSSPAPSVLPDVSYDDMNGETFSLLGEIAKEQGYGESAWDETAKAMGIEIGVSMGGIYTTTKAMKYLNNFRKVRRVVQAGQLAAGTTGVGTVPALVSAVATEGAFALAGNYLSQKYRQSVGIQEGINSGEILATGLLLNPVVRQGQKIRFLKKYFDPEMATKGIKLKAGSYAVQGATVGLVSNSIEQSFNFLFANDSEFNRDLTWTDRVAQLGLSTGVGSTIGGGGITALDEGLTRSSVLFGRWREAVALSKVNMTGDLKTDIDKLVDRLGKVKNNRRSRAAIIRTLRQKRKELRDVEAIHDSVTEELDGYEQASEQQASMDEKQRNRVDEVIEARRRRDEGEAEPTPTEPLMESEIEGVPDASNAQRTQVATTTQTYVRSASILEDFGEGKILDFGAGRGAGAEAIDADSYEPYPRENFVPTFTDSTDIPSGSYEKIISPSVLNVVPKDVRNGIVTEIGRILKEGGHAVITTRTVQDVKGAKFKKPHSSEENAFIVGKDESTATYQKGFSDKELREYLQQTLGDNFEVLPLPKAKDGKKVNGATALIRKKTQDAPSTPEPTPTPQTENNFKPKKVKGAGDTYPVYELTINGKRVFIGSSDTASAGRIFHVTDADGMEHLSFSGEELGDNPFGSNANDFRDSFDTRKELIEELQRRAEQEAPATPEPTPADPPPPQDPPPPAPTGGEEGGRRNIFQDIIDEVKVLKENRQNGVAITITNKVSDAFKGATAEFEDNLDRLVANFDDIEALDNLLADLDDYAKLAEEFYELDYIDANVLQTRRDDRGIDNFKEIITLERQEKLRNFQRLKTKLQIFKNDKNFEGIEDLYRKLFPEEEEVDIDVDTPDAPATEEPTSTPEAEPTPDAEPTPEAEQPTPEGKPTPEGEQPKPKKPRKTRKDKLTASQRAVRRLTKELERLRREFVNDGEDIDPKTGRPRRAKSEEEKDLEARIAFYKGAGKDVAKIAELEERNALLSSLVAGEDVSAINQQIGMHPKKKKELALFNPEKQESYLNTLKEREALLKKQLRDLQANEIAFEIDKIINTSKYTQGAVGNLINGYLTFRTAAFLDQMTTATSGIPSAMWYTLSDPIRDIPKNIIRAAVLKDASVIERLKFAASSNLAFYDAVMTMFRLDTYKGMYRTVRTRGQSSLFYKDSNRYDEAAEGTPFGGSRRMQGGNTLQRRAAQVTPDAEGAFGGFIRKVSGAPPAQAAAELIFLGQTMLGTIDVPFERAMLMGKLRAEGLRRAIREGATNQQEFIKAYMDAAFMEKNGMKVFNYEQSEYRDIANEVRGNLFKRRDLYDGDIQLTEAERLVNLINKHTGRGVVFSNLFRLFFAIISTPIRATARTIDFAISPIAEPIAKSVGLTALATRRGEGRVSSIFGKYNAKIGNLEADLTKIDRLLKDESNSEMQIKRLEASRDAKREELRVTEELRNEQYLNDVGKTMLAAGLYILFWKMAESGQITGSGAHLTNDQKRESKFQAYKLIGEDDDGTYMRDYRLFEPLRLIASLTADMQAYYALKSVGQEDKSLFELATSEDRGALTENQTAMATLRRSFRSALTDMPFTTGYRQLIDIFLPRSDDPDTAEAISKQAQLQLVGSLVPIPAQIRGINRQDDLVYYDKSQGDTFSNIFANALSTETPNVFRDKLGRPSQRPEQNASTIVFRYGKQRMPSPYEPELDEIINDDAKRGGFITKLPTRIGNLELKKFVNEETGETLYQRYADHVAYEVEFRGNNLIEALVAEIEKERWDDSYKDGEITFGDPRNEIVNRIGAIDSNVSQKSNKGLERLQDIILKYRARAKRDLLKLEFTEGYFINYRGQKMSVEEYLEMTQERVIPSVMNF